MKINNYECKCGCNDLFFKEKGSQVGIYCSSCGKWLKWADKNERNLMNSNNYDPKKPFDFFGVEFPSIEKDKEVKTVDSTSDEAKTVQLQQALDRAKVLLKATYDILRKQEESPYVLNVLATTAEYDGTECDGYCLEEDIENWFGENFNEWIKE